MDIGVRRCAVCSDIERLPEECLSRVISLTSPRDACRSAAVSATFRSAAVSDDVWKNFSPSDYAEILARAVNPVEFASKKQLYFRLCNPILIDDGRMGFFVDRESGSKCFILSARELRIVWADTPQYWRWIQHPESMFFEVAELDHVRWLDIRGSINSNILSKQSNYSAYLIFKLSNNASGFKYFRQEALIVIGAYVSKLWVLLEGRPIRGRPRHGRSNYDHETIGNPQTREDGWMEIFLGEFYNEEGDDGEVVISILDHRCQRWKRGLIVHGIEIRPKN